METSLICAIDSQIKCLQQTLGLTESLREQCKKLEVEKNDAIAKCEDLKVELKRLSNKKCSKCSFLINELKKEREEKEKLKKEEKTKLLKTIARTLASLDDGNTDQVNQLFTELFCYNLNNSSDQEEERGISLIEDRERSEDEDESKILVHETVIENGDEKNITKFKEHPITIPETEGMDSFPQKIASKKVFRNIDLPKLRTQNSSDSKENVFPDNIDMNEQATKKLRMSPILSSQKFSPPRDKMGGNSSHRSPSVLSEIIEVAGGLNSSHPDEKGVAWKMKPSVLMESASTTTTNGKKLKQMTLSLTRMEKKHDISHSDNFKGGVAKFSDEDDIIQPSPERHTKTFVKKRTLGETLEDPDMTVFNPVITSTCLPAPVETSFDRLPDVQKSPKYKYRRETVRKKCERMRLPGQDCDQCAKYYEAAGLDHTQEVRARLNQCSRHRDKYQIRANTPPGFWDPVLPTTPEDS